jgi:hypothetical protein
LAYAVTFRILKNSARNWALMRSVTFHLLVGHIQQAQAIVPEDIPAHRAQSPQTGGKHHGIAHHIAIPFESELAAFGPMLVAFDKHVAFDVPERTTVSPRNRGD